MKEIYTLSNKQETLIFTRKIDCIFYQAEQYSQRNRMRYKEVDAKKKHYLVQRGAKVV